MMDTKIQIHDDYCANMASEDIRAILAQVTTLITEAVLRGVEHLEEQEEVA